MPIAQAANTSRITSVEVIDDTAYVVAAANTTLKSVTYEFTLSNLKDGKLVSKVYKTSLGSISLKGLSWFTDYKVQSRIVKSGKKYPLSSPYSFRVSGPSLDSPTFSEVAQTKVTVNWPEKTFYDTYQILVDGKIVIAKNTGFVLTNLVPGTAYKVSVRGVSNSRLGSPSLASVVVTSNDGPQNLKAVATSNSLTLNWTAIAGVTKYNIYKDSSLVGSSTSNSYVLSDLKPGSWYSMGVTALFDVHETAVTADKFETLQVKAAKPVISGINSTFATVSWTSVPEAKKYLISVYDQTGLTPAAIGKGSGTFLVAQGINSIVLQGLTSSQIYTVTLTYIYDDTDGKSMSKSLPSDFVTFTSIKPVIGTLTNLATTTTTSSISWGAGDGVIQYEIFRDNVYLTLTEKSVTSYQFTGLVPGTTYKLGVKARYYDSNGVLQTSEQSSISVTTLTDATAVPVVSVAPTITLTSGISPVIGMTLTASSGAWSTSTPITGYLYQWQRGVDTSSFTNIDGATSSTYVVSSNDLSLYLRVRVTATNSNASSNTFSNNTNVVIATGNLLLPIISGKPVVGEVLDTSDGVWNASGVITYTYQWLSSGSSISGATASKFTVTSSEAGTRISVIVTATTKNGSTSATSASTAIVYPTGNTVLPTISGTARVGNVLTSTTGTWLNTPTITYNWQRSLDGFAWVNTGGTSSTYTITNDDAGYYLRVQVIGTKSAGTTASVIAESSNTVPVPNLLISNSVRPALSGSWTQGQTLTTTSGTWSVSGTYTYQWQRSTDNSTYTDITSATSSSYVLTSSDASKYIRVQVTNTSSTGSGVAYSNNTPKVDSPYNTALPTISGTIQVGATQTVTNGTWSNSPTSYAYQWQSSSDGIAWSNIASATSSTYSPTFAIANLQLRVSVSAVNAVDTATVTTAIISNFLPPSVTTIPVVSGTVQVGQTLTSDGGTWPGTSNSYRVFTWQRSADAGLTWVSISGATSSTYVLVAADTGYLIRSQVSLTTNAGTASAYSLPTVAVAP